MEEGQVKGEDEAELPAGLSAAIFVCLTFISIATLSLLLVSKSDLNTAQGTGHKPLKMIDRG